MINRNDVQLTEEELQIERDIKAGKYVSVQNLEAEKKRLSELVKQSKKRKKLSIRVSEWDLLIIKQKAEQLWLPYQTLINSILHQFTSRQIKSHSGEAE